MLEAIKRIAARTQGGSYTVLGQQAIDITQLKAVQSTIGKTTTTRYVVTVPIMEGTNKVSEIQITAAKGTDSLTNLALQMEQCLKDKPYNVEGNSGVTPAGKIRFTVVEGVSNPLTDEVWKSAITLFTSMEEAEVAALKAKQQPAPTPVVGP